MNCLNCAEPLSDPILKSETGRFACPVCKAEHVRRLVGHLPSGEPLHSLRLWGHLTAVRKKPERRPTP